MKKIIGYTLSWTLYGLGDLVSKPMHLTYGYWLYHVYNRLMIWSYDVQDRSSTDVPWR